MMPERQYISERIDKNTFIKGRFKGKFNGQLDKTKSDLKHERYFDLEIIDGEIYTTQSDIQKWPAGTELKEFVNVSTFPTALPGKIKVSLRYFDGSIKHFKIRLKELKLINCYVSNQVYRGNELMGTIEGDVSGYLLHYDTLLNEIQEEEEDPLEHTPPHQPNIDQNNSEPEGEQKPIPAQLYNPKTKSSFLSVLNILAGLFFLLGILIIIRYPQLIAIFALLAMLSFPRLYRFLPNRIRSRITTHRATVLFGLLLCLAMYFLITGYEAKKKKEHVSNVLAEKAREKRVADNRIQKQRADSFNRYLDTAKTLLKSNKKEEALQKLEKASVFASSDERGMINSETEKLYNSLAEDLSGSGNYKGAIEMYSTLLTNNKTNPEYFYKRAVCYNRTGKTQEAVNDLKQAINLGDKPSQLLYEKINPIKKRVAYYVTLCCDGTHSNAKGRGACSHHGGVCNWNEPVYEEYREYQ
jgi:tetratricopeptide (TPR) repeat protein